MEGGGQDLLHLQLLKIACAARNKFKTEVATSTRNAFPNRGYLQYFAIMFSSLQQVTPISLKNLYNSPFSENLHGGLRIKVKAISFTYLGFLQRKVCVLHNQGESWRVKMFPLLVGSGKMS